MKKDLISLKDLSRQEIEEIFALTDKIKKDKTRFNRCLSGKTLALVFEKPSCRTRVSFEAGMYELGGYSLYLGPQEINLGVREQIRDVARSLSRYVSGIVLRTFDHKNVLEMANYATVPVINGLSDFSHPCQVLSDLYTIREKFKRLKGINLAYVGDGNNNVCHSLLFVCPKVGINLAVASPLSYQPQKIVLAEAEKWSKKNKTHFNLTINPIEAVKNADIIYTDVWTSMGKEKEAQIRRKAFKGYQVNQQLVSLAKKNCGIMHCLPAHRGEEITDEVMESKNSIIFEQAENRLHLQKAILILWLK